MAHSVQPNYLCTLRKRWALSQTELGRLVGVTGSAIGKYEQRRRAPHREVMLALEIVFDVPAREIFGPYFEKIRERVMRRAAKLDAATRNRTDSASRKKQVLLNSMSQRLRSGPSRQDGSD